MSDEERIAYNDLDDDGKRERITSMRDRADSTQAKFSKGSYYSWGETIDDIRRAEGAAETAVAGGKWAGKSLFNIGKFAVAEVVPGVMKSVARMSEENLKNKK
ncbi:hypothetical protein [Psychrobacter okhotskensis]|uniref:hypothetical protein n=1 Tax=Psychrobacter TaxID=497 RepID=UPI0019198460|nr:hypothetical protein [Psychrobacter okhotskensis]